MQVAVVGAGNVGQALAGGFVRAGHDVTITASSPEGAERKAQNMARAPQPLTVTRHGTRT